MLFRSAFGSGHRTDLIHGDEFRILYRRDPGFPGCGFASIFIAVFFVGDGLYQIGFVIERSDNIKCSRSAIGINLIPIADDIRVDFAVGGIAQWRSQAGTEQQQNAGKNGKSSEFPEDCPLTF